MKSRVLRVNPTELNRKVEYGDCRLVKDPCTDPSTPKGGLGPRNATEDAYKQARRVSTPVRTFKRVETPRVTRYTKTPLAILARKKA